jgi:cell division protein FtsI (penicillin-binding protein 3)
MSKFSHHPHKVIQGIAKHNPLSRKKLHAVEEEHDSGKVNRLRLLTVVTMFALGFLVISCRLVDVSLLGQIDDTAGQSALNSEATFKRGDIVDRNGVLLAVNLATASVYANPKIILDAKSAASKLAKVLPDLNYKQLMKELSSRKSFVWIKRNLTPKEQYAVNSLGIPGVSFERGEKRVYPHGNLLAHVLGYVGLDGKGLSGIEKQFDKRLAIDKTTKNTQEPLQLSLDLRVQSILHEELSKAKEEFKAIGATGVVMDATSGEVLAMVSLPDFDPHNPGGASVEQRFNRSTLGVYEMGSTFKTFTMAMALDAEKIRLSDSFDVNAPIHAARFRITDYHAKGGWLSVPEIFMYSSNIGTAKIAMEVGGKVQRDFLKKLGLLSPLEIELPEKAPPMYPAESRWSDISTMTISYGHGIAVTPLHMTKAISALVNGGMLHPVTLLKKIDDTEIPAAQVVSDKTSDNIRRLLRLVVEHGTGNKAAVPGYVVGGKTGTAEKNSRGGYSQHAKLSSFIAAFPINNPRFVILAVLDEPKGTKATGGYATGGMVAAPVVASVVSRMGPLYGMMPIDEESDAIKKALYIEYRKDGDKI